ncbi:hypothetical protein R5R35_010430 [Gryllus longicercus]|uniref:Regulator of microtubule dynamics protein 1 n=1 Tax=Gryllus longicercus TaxID=2509291 RepID=A0AAN9Z982_9ORTH
MITHAFQRYRVAFYIFTSVLRNYKHKIAFPNAPLRHSDKLCRREFSPVFSQWIPIFGLIYAASPTQNDRSPLKKATKQLLEEADELFNAFHYEDTYKLLKDYKDSDDVEALWRICRALYNHSKEELDTKIKKALVVEAFIIIKRALALNDNHFATHKWYAILLDAHASYAGIKARINELLNVKNHMVRAAELNPKDATTLYMLGSWCFSIADMPWYQRKIASTLFATPPSSSYEEALKYFIKAEEVDPNFYSLNLLMLGKTYLRLKDKERAIHYLKLTTAYPAKTDEDMQAKKEAAEILKSIKE